MIGGREEFERDALIVNRSVTLAEVAEQLLEEDAGIGLIRAALVAWEHQYGRPAALELARTALIGIMTEMEQGAGRSN
ncbi:MAG: hypothetical protein PGN21_08390 [Sphingomonas paucimobilis]